MGLQPLHAESSASGTVQSSGVRAQAGRTPTFTEHLKLVLESFSAASAASVASVAEAIGSTSPLAAPYFLGAAIQQRDASAQARGAALIQQIELALAALWGGPLPDDGDELLAAALDKEEAGTGRYDCLILELNYLKQRVRPVARNQAEIYHDRLHISRPTHDRHLRGAVERLGIQLLRRLRPAVRPEEPVAPPTLIGRDALLARILADLHAGKTVSLTGPGGIGKTSLAAAVADRWSTPGVFWYTIRPTLNDQIESLFFALGHFLHTHGASTLWQQLIAEGGRIKDSSLGLGLAIADLARLPQPTLLCFDEMDFLRPLTPDQANLQHVQLLEVLESLQGHTALLLVGQRAFWQSDCFYALDGWTVEQLAQWLDTLAIPYTPEDSARLHSFTAGNPRLAELCVAFYLAGEQTEPLHTVLDQLPRFQALLPLWLRLERRLPPAERQVLQSLSVFRSPAPADVWRVPTGDAANEAADALNQLIQRRLVQEDGKGGVMLLPALREVVYAELPIETQEARHEHAAQVRAIRGEYTAAAYHLVRAGHPAAAVELWYPQREGEIHRGEAGAATAIFGQISQRRLPPQTRKQLRLLRSELYALMGKPAAVIAELAQESWPTESTDTPEARLRWGEATAALGDSEAALDHYAAGLDAVLHVLGQGAQLQVQRSYTYLRRRDMQAAAREANLARFHTETILGVVQDQQGDYQTAQAHYERALATAQACDYAPGVAQTYHYLAMLAGRRQAREEAARHFEQAMAYYEQIGDRVQREYVRGNLASALIQARRFAEALAPATAALRFFQSMGNPFRIAQNASNLAEAHAELGNLSQAQHYAELVLEQEEPHSHPYALYTLGTVYKLQARWEQAGAYYAHSAQMAESNDDRYLLAFARRAQAEVWLAQEKWVQAETAGRQAKDIFEELGLDDEVQQTVAVLARRDAKDPKRETSGVAHPA